jgi:sulfate adenylyltransferase subunit 1
MSVVLNLEDDIDVSRGDLIAKKNNQPNVTQEVDAMICWFNPIAAKTRHKYAMLHTTNSTKAMITDIVYKIDIHSLDRDMDDKTIGMNDICRMKFKTAKPIMSDPYRENRFTGSFILIDDATNETVAAGMIL